MSEVRGQEGFDGPSEQELETYIKQSRKSLSRMKRGKSPLIFRPKKNRTKILIGIVLLIVIPSGFLSIASLMRSLPSGTNLTNDTETTPLTSESLNLELTANMLEAIIFEMISQNHSTINPVIIEGSVVKSRLISNVELLDLIWYLNQFERGSQWWDLGRELLFEKFPLWNESFTDLEGYELQIRALRSYLVYTPEEIPLNPYNLEIFHNSCIYLWKKVLAKTDNLTNTLSSFPNDSFRLTSDQILFIEFLSEAATFPNLFNLSLLHNNAKNLVETLDQLTNKTYGIPESFYANLSWTSPIYNCKEQGDLILALHRLDNALHLDFSLDPLINRLNKFIGNYLINLDWSCNKYYNFTNRKPSEGILASDQSLIIRCNVFFENLQYGKYVAVSLIEKLQAPNSGFYPSLSDQSSQHLLDQIQILLAFQELILLESIIIPPSSIAAASWGFGVFLIILPILFTLKRRVRKRKYSHND
ncbi:MAG: hypothetical protein ACFFB5_08010 [Promethearchaeota archaeon]